MVMQINKRHRGNKMQGNIMNIFIYIIVKIYINQMSLISQQQNSSTSGSFSLIWHYWFKRYMQRKNKKSSHAQQLAALKLKYKIEAIEAQGSTEFRQKIQQIKQKVKAGPTINLQSNFSAATTNSTNSFTNPPLFYTINPQIQAKQIEQTILDSQQLLDKQECKQMINQLYSYYLNIKTVFIIYKQQKDSLLQETVTKLLNSSNNDSSLRASKLTLSALLNEDDSLGGLDRNDSILQSYDKMEDKIDNLELIDKLAEIEGLQIWNAKYYNIPHCYVKVKKNCWAKSLSQTVSNNPNALTNPPIFHPCHPKAISSLPIIPRINKFRPSIDKLQPFISYMEMLWLRSPNLSPTCQSIFQYNGFPYIFTQDYRQQSIAVLCYYIVYGNQQNSLSQKFVERWMEYNPTTMLTKTIRYMKQLVRNKNLQQKSQSIKMLFNQNDLIW